MGYDRNDPWMTCGERDDRCDQLSIDDPFAEVEEFQELFDLQWKADQRAIKRWQEAHPGNDLVWPDRADMVVWLMDEHDRMTTELNDARKTA